MQRARRDDLAEQLAGAEQMLLADDLVERARTHPIGERLGHQLPRAKESLIVVGLAPCHCNDATTSQFAGNAHHRSGQHVSQLFKNAKPWLFLKPPFYLTYL